MSHKTFLAILLGCLIFGNAAMMEKALPRTVASETIERGPITPEVSTISVETIHEIIEAQNVTRNKEIKLKHLKYLDAKYSMVLVIFLQRFIQESDILVENGGISKNLSTSLTTDSNNLLKLTIRGDIMMNSGKRLKISYIGNDALSMKKEPKSYIVLTYDRNRKIPMTTMAEGSTGTNKQNAVTIVCLVFLCFVL